MLATSFILSWFKPKQKGGVPVQSVAAVQSTSDTSFVSRATNNKLVSVTMAEDDSDFVAIDCQPLTYAEVASLAPTTVTKSEARSGAADAAVSAVLPELEKNTEGLEQSVASVGGAGTTVGVPLTSEYDLTKSGFHYRKSRLEKKKQHAFVEKKKMKKKKAKKAALSKVA